MGGGGGGEFVAIITSHSSVCKGPFLTSLVSSLNLAKCIFRKRLD